MDVCFNGEFFPVDAPLLPVQNRGYKWGDGVFETMKMFRGKLLLSPLHFERLFSSLRLLGIDFSPELSPQNLIVQIIQLCRQNNCLPNARIRLAVYRDDEKGAGYSIEAIALNEETNQWQEEGLNIGLYPFARKSMDAFANVKSANYLPYVLAQRYATEKGMDDALVLNTKNFLCDSSKANLFIIKSRNIYTPALHQGCVNGVMRRKVLEEIKSLGYRFFQGEVEEAQLLAADEVFLTNAIQVIRWVRSYKTAVFECAQTRQIYKAIAATLFYECADESN